MFICPNSKSDPKTARNYRVLCLRQLLIVFNWIDMKNPYYMGALINCTYLLVKMKEILSYRNSFVFYPDIQLDLQWDITPTRVAAYLEFQPTVFLFGVLSLFFLA